LVDSKLMAYKSCANVINVVHDVVKDVTLKLERVECDGSAGEVMEPPQEH
jgi:hypothetical protein